MNGRKYSREFELISKKGNWERLRVPGGWQVHHVTKYLIGDKIAFVSECSNFIPDPDGSWIFEEE